MKPIPTSCGSVFALALVATACVSAPRPAPTPTIVTPRPVAANPPLPAPSFAKWMDAPQTPGDWTYSALPGGGVAQFGDGAVTTFRIRCDAASRRVELTRFGVAGGAQQMTVRTEAQTRTLAAVASPLALTAQLFSSDRLLDAMALSKGRFAIEVGGAPVLYLPSWAEVTRVIEDCR